MDSPLLQLTKRESVSNMSNHPKRGLFVGPEARPFVVVYLLTFKAAVEALNVLGRAAARDPAMKRRGHQ